MGEVNHSTRFIEYFVTPMFQVLVQRLQNILDEPFPCTGKPPFAILGDKGTIKRDVTQPRLIRTVSLCKNKLFDLSHPEVMSHKGEDITDLLLSSFSKDTGLVSWENPRKMLWGIVRWTVFSLECACPFSQRISFLSSKVLQRTASHRASPTSSNLLVKTQRKKPAGFRNWTIRCSQS